MAWISGFWAGACQYGRGGSVWELGQSVGGIAELERGGESALVAAGIDPAVAQAWDRSLPVQTDGEPLTMGDPRYPARLLGLSEAPPVLIVQGRVDCLQGPAWGIVGTRSCTPYGAGVTRHLAGRLAASGATVVSGLARGIDAHAHRAALAVGRTVAVLGHGLAHTAPASHRTLRRQILDSGGAIVTGFLDEVPPRPHTFPQRNPWISGLSDGVIVVEAGARSGAAITARAAAEQGREVVAVPGPLGAPQSVGCLRLLRDGARCLWDVDEFVEDVLGAAPLPRAQWLDALFKGASVDDVARSASRPVSVLLAELSVMELDGTVVRMAGQRFAPGPRLVSAVVR